MRASFQSFSVGLILSVILLYLILVAAVMLAIYFLSRRPVAGAVSYAVGLLIAASGG